MAPDSNSGANLIVQYFAPTSAEKTRLQDAIARTAQTLMFQLSPLK